MRQPQFRYNPKTLRFERVGFSFWRSGVTMLSYLSFGFIFFLGLNVLQNFLLETSLEKSLMAENKSLIKYKTVLTSQLHEANLSLNVLTREEQQLHEKLFESPSETISAPARVSVASIIDTDDFDKAIESVEEQFASIHTKAKKTNQFFGSRIQIKKSDVSELLTTPSISPVKNLTEENLVSGFGIRINPFHKGNYHHDGIDIALPKGTQVLATANGTVTTYNNFSNLEGGFGNYVEIDHGHGLVTRYSHLESTSVTWGQKIKKGQTIGLSGSSGGSVAPHLHYDVILHGKNVNPITYLIEGISPSQHAQLALKGKTQNQSLD